MYEEYVKKYRLSNWQYSTQRNLKQKSLTVIKYSYHNIQSISIYFDGVWYATAFCQPCHVHVEFKHTFLGYGGNQTLLTACLCILYSLSSGWTSCLCCLFCRRSFIGLGTYRSCFALLCSDSILDRHFEGHTCRSPFLASSRSFYLNIGLSSFSRSSGPFRSRYLFV